MSGSICQQNISVLGGLGVSGGYWEPVLMLILLVCSAFFSGAETAFFNLTPRQKKSMESSSHRLEHLAGSLAHRPSQMLSCLLFGNMTVNVLYFAAACVLTSRIGHRLGVGVGTAAAVLSFSILILFGEILPKSLAYLNSKSISVAAAMPVVFFLRVFMPVIYLARLIVVEPVIRLFLGSARHPKPVTRSEFILLVEQARAHGLITDGQDRLLAETLELGFLKVRDCLKPRVDMVTCAVTESAQKARQLMQQNGLIKMPVYAGNIDNIVGMISMRQLLLESDKPLEQLMEKVNFVPEQKTIVSLLQFFRTTHTDAAIAVDEYGGIAGYIRLEDIAEELLGPIETESPIKPIEQLGPFTYRMAGSLALRDWIDIFGIDPAASRLSTLGGLVTTLLGRIPRTGDAAHWKNLKFVVEKMRKKRVETVILTLEQIPNDVS